MRCRIKDKNFQSAKSRSQTKWVFLVNGFIFIAIFLSSTIALATDQENCLMCHKYPGLGRYDKDEEGQRAVKKIFYVNEELYQPSYHGKLRCKACHEGVDQIPHTDVKKVDCASDCHIKDPSTGRDFSHKAIVEDLTKSAHGTEGSRSDNKKDLPTCKNCHSNKPYQMDVAEQAKSMGFLQVCLECHESKEWADRFYRHIVYNASRRRPSKEVVTVLGDPP